MALLDFGRLMRAAGQTIQGLPENAGVRGGLSLLSANQPGQRNPVDQPGSFLKGMLQANSLKQNRLALEEAAKEKARQEAQRVAANQFFNNVANRPQMVADRQSQIAQMVAERELTPFNAADMRATLPFDMQARSQSIGNVGQQTPIHSEPFPDAIPTIAQMGLTSGVPAIQGKTFESMMKTPDLTAAEQNARSLGLIPGSPESNNYIREYTVGANMRFEPEAKKLAAQDNFKVMQGSRKGAVSAIKTASDLRTVANLLSDFEGGPTAELSQKANRLITSTFGMGDKAMKDGVASAELAKTLINKMTIGNRSTADGGGMPGQMSDRDLQFLVEMIPQLTTSIAGRELIAQAAEIVADAAQAQAIRVAEEYRRTGGRISTEFILNEETIRGQHILTSLEEQMLAAAVESPHSFDFNLNNGADLISRKTATNAVKF